MALLDKIFKVCDLDANGGLSKGEVAADACEAAIVAATGAPVTEAKFDEVDTDGNGEVTKKEAIAHHVANSRGI